MPELDVLLLLMLIAGVAGWVDAIAGGGGVIILPSLLVAGLNPVEALATNKLQACFGSGTATLNFVHKGLLDVRAAWFAILCTFVGASVGTLAVRWLSRDFLETLIPVLLIALALFLLFGMRFFSTVSRVRMQASTFALVVGAGIGFYDGFFGPGTGTFFAMAYMLLLGQSMVNATIRSKLLNFTSNIAALVFFALSGNVQWITGLVMAVGQMSGAYLGSNMVVSKGATLIRPIMIWMSVLVSLKLLFFS